MLILNLYCACVSENFRIKILLNFYLSTKNMAKKQASGFAILPRTTDR